MADRSMTRRDAELAVHGFQAGNPEAGGLVVLLGLLLLVALQVLVVSASLGFLAVAVVRLVVEDEDVLHAHQVGHDPLDHLAFGFQGVRAPRRRPCKQAPGRPCESSMRSRSLKAW